MPDTEILPPFPGVPLPDASLAEDPASRPPQPRTHITTLPSGLRVVTQETYMPMTSLGIVVDAGSRQSFAAHGAVGVAHLAELMAFKSTLRRDHAGVLAAVEQMGGMVNANSSREQMLYVVDALRENVEEAVALLAETVLVPSFAADEIDEGREVLAFLYDEAADQLVRSCCRRPRTAPLAAGVPHFCPHADARALDARAARVPRGSDTAPRRRRGRGRRARGSCACASGTRAAPSAAARRARRARARRRGAAAAARRFAEYVGGEQRLEVPNYEKNEKGYVRVAAAFEIGGWHDDDLVAACVLQQLLGGGDSFSAGGPGKGMYSRLYREVLNRHSWCDAAEAFLALHDDTGLLGISGAAEPRRAGELVGVFLEQLVRLAEVPVDADALARARNMLKLNVLTQLESRLVLFEDLARQVATYGHREDMAKASARIDAVTAEDILRIGRRMLSKPPSIAAHGRDLSRVPPYSAVMAELARRR